MRKSVLLKKAVREPEEAKTAIRLMEESPQKSARRFRSIFNSILQLTGLMTPDGTLIEANQAALDFAGARLEEVVNQPFWETCWWQGNETRIRKLKDDVSKAARGEFVRYEVELQGVGNTTATFDFSIKPVFDLEGEVAFLIPEGRDITDRKRAEELLRRSEDRYRFLLANTSDCVTHCSLRGILLFASDALYSITGFKPEEITGTSAFDHAHPDDGPQIRAALEEAVEKGTHHTIEYRTLCKDGGYKWIEVSGKVVQNDQTGQKEIVAVVHDIDNRKRTEQELWKQYELQRVLLSAIPAYVYVKDTDSVYLLGNKHFSELSGIAENEIPGKSDYDFFSETDADCFRKDDAEIIATGKAKLNYEVKGQDSKGNTMWYSTSKSPFSDPTGRKAGLVGICMNITERKRVEEELRKSEEKFRLLVENSHDIIYSVSAEGTLIFVSPAWTNLLGHPVPQVTGKSFQLFVHPDDVPRCILFLKSVIETGIRQDGIEYRVKHADGTWYWHTSSAVPLMDEDGNITGFYGIAKDITRRKQMEEELEGYHKHLENLVQVRTEELENKNIALHELNTALKVLLKQREDDKKDLEDGFVINLLNMVLPFIEHMKDGTLDDRQRSCLDIIEAHLNDVTKPLLKNMRQFNLTPMEIKVAALVRRGMSTKEIANILGIASGSIDVHRKHIRGKLGLNNRKVNLTSYLEGLEQ